MINLGLTLYRYATTRIAAAAAESVGPPVAPELQPPASSVGELRGRKVTYPTTGQNLDNFITVFVKEYFVSNSTSNVPKIKKTREEMFFEKQNASFLTLSDQKLNEMSIFLCNILNDIRNFSREATKSDPDFVKDFLKEMIQLLINSSTKNKNAFISQIRELCADKEFSEDVLNKLLLFLLELKPSLEILQRARQIFQEDYEKAKLKAYDIHKIFSRICFEKSSFVKMIDSSTRNQLTCTTPFQFKSATALARKEFKALATLASSYEEISQYTRLVQIILCGNEAETFPLPTSDCCFYFRELEHVNLLEKLDPLKDGESFVSRELKNVLPENERKKDETDEMFNKRKFARVVSSFILDSLERGSYIFERGEIRYPTVYPLQSIPDRQFFLKTIKERYTQFLLENPTKIGAIIKNNNQSGLFKLAQQLFGKNLKENEFSESILEAIMELHNSNDYVKLILESTRMDPEKIIEIAKKSQLSPERIEPLVRMKILEIFVLMNQSQQAFATGCLLSKLGLDKLEDRCPLISGVNPSGKLTFLFANDDFNSVTQSLTFKAVTLEFGYLKPYQAKGSNVALVEFAAVSKIPSTNTSTHAEMPELSVFGNPTFSCFAPLEVVNYIISQVDPKSIVGTLTGKDSVSEKRLKEIIEQLTQLSRSPVRFYSPQSWSSANSEPEKGATEIRKLIVEGYHLLRLVIERSLEHAQNLGSEVFHRDFFNALTALKAKISANKNNDDKTKEVLSLIERLLSKHKPN